jgi:tetratricopeptide (TPR) repeat protein
MIEVTCGACGTTHRFADGDVPAAGKMVTCARCKARLRVPGPADAGFLDLAEPAAGGTGDVIDLADLPAPKRSAGPAQGKKSTAAASGPPPITSPIPTLDIAGLAADVAESSKGISDLPAPVGPTGSRGKPDVKMPAIPPARPGTPPPTPGGRAAAPPARKPDVPAFELDLPAPVGPTSSKGIVDLPAPVGPTGSRGAVADLPAPVGPTGSRGAVADLPAPVGPTSAKASVMDLPAPVGPTSAKGSVMDLPAPVGPTSAKGSVMDLPAPVGPTSAKGSVMDLPAPVGPTSAKRPAVPAVPPLVPPAARPAAAPAPRPATAPAPTATPTARGIAPLDPVRPAPARGSEAPTLDLDGLDRLDGLDDMLTPGAIGLDDLGDPASAGDDIDLPVPKGFFDDLPQPVDPARTGLPAPVGPRGTADLPAPKGFFDDLPQPSLGASRPPSTAGAGAGAGNFLDEAPPSGLHARAMDLDDLDLAPPSIPPGQVPSFSLPAPAAAAAPYGGSPYGAPGPGALGDGLDLDGPSGASAPFELPGPAPSPAPRPAPGMSQRLDMSSGGSLGAGGLDLGAPPPRAPLPMGGLDLDAAAPVPALELPDSGPDPYGGLDLPGAGPGASSSGVSFKPAGRGGDPAPAPSMPSSSAFDLDIDETKAKPKPITRAVPIRPQPTSAAAPPRPSRRKRNLLAAAGLVVLAAVGGGLYGYTRWQAQQERAAQVESDIAQARTQLADASAGHWKRAATFAERAHELDKDDVAALALAAQGHYAGYLDEGTEGTRRLAAGADLVQTLIASGKRGPDADKALALKAIVDGQTERAVQRLDSVLATAPTDGDALLYLGWARAGAGDWQGAVAAFDRALAAKPKRDIPLHYGRGQAKLGLGDRDGARADFAAVIDKDKEHIGAQVGIAAAAPPAAFSRREADLLALLERKDIGRADPRAVARAWILAGDDARRAGRLDAARDRYRKALAILPRATAALVGEAETELRDGNLEAAVAAAERALQRDPDDVAANLVAAEVDLRRGKRAEARSRLDALANRQPPLQSPLDRARLLVLTGALLEAQPGKEVEALAAYDEARAIVGDADVGPSIAAARLLARLADQAGDARRSDEAADYRKRADALLAPLAAQAEADPATAIALGVAYLAAEDPARAETWLRRALAARPTDAEGHFQLAGALERQGKRADSLESLRKAFELEPERVDVGLALARGLDEAGRKSDAGAMYEKLLAGTDVSLEVRIRAGRFWARSGDIARARAQGAAIRQADADDPNGLFLEAEGLFADRKLIEARRLYQQASDTSEDALFLDGLGRAAEALGAAQGDSRYKDEALRAYTRASELEPRLLTSVIGRGRLLLERRDAAKALAALEAANQLAPGNPDVQYGIGVAHQELGDRKNAVTWLERALAARPSAEGFYRLGLLHYDLDRGRDAAGALWSATDLAAADERKLGTTVAWLTDAYYLLGSIENAMRRDAQAKRAWEQYLARGSSNKTQEQEVRRLMLGLRGR